MPAPLYSPPMTSTRQFIAPYASDPAESQGRRYTEPESATRTAFQRDRDRIIHCAAFRRLEYKTQVFVYHEGDYYRTRLTHSLETAQIARSISRVLGLNEDLAEALALAHDLGHTPFGHAGEDALKAAMADYGGFDHNTQTLRILTTLEERYAEFDGLNLTWESLEGTVKHNGPLLPAKNGLPPAIARYNESHDLELASYPGPEAQVAAIADDIAYNNHDVDDGLRAGLFSYEDMADVALVGPVFAEVRATYPDLDESRLVHEAVRRMIGEMVSDILEESRKRLDAAACGSAAEVRALDHPVIAFSESMAANDRILKDFLYRRMYRHYKVNRMASKARRVVRELFSLFIAEPECLPNDWQARCNGAHSPETARAVADYIAGMTDRFAFLEYQRLFDVPL
jgi:dGTPase